MPKKVTKSGLAAKLSPEAVDAFENTKGNDTVLGFSSGGLPGGIKGGIAKLVRARFGEYKSGPNEGELFLNLMATVVRPKKFIDAKGNEFITAGEFTTQTLALCATSGKTERSAEENMDRALNELRKLGLETKDLPIDEWETAVQSLQEARPYFKFSTSQSEPNEEYPDPRVFENWNGAIEDFDEADVGNDEEVSEEVTEEPPKRSAPAAPAKPAAKPSKPAAPPLKVADEIEEEEEEAAEEEVDLDALGKLADKSNDEEAQTQLADIAESLGVDSEELPNWAAVVKAIKAAQTASEEPEEEPEAEAEEEAPQPEKEEVYYYTPPKAKKAIECEVTAVFTTKKTVNLKNLEDGSSIKGVAWTELKSEN